jgi:hypothetical protein
MLPAMAAGAVGFAVLAMVIPIPAPSKPDIAPPEAPSAAAPAAAAPEAAKPVESWAELGESLGKLTDKVAETAVATNQPEETKAAEPAAQPQQSALPPLSWRYKGTIQGPGSIAALVITATGSRLLFVGMRLSDEHDPAGPGVVVKEITSEAVVLDRRGMDVSLPFEPREPTTELGRLFLSSQSDASPTPRVDPAIPPVVPAIRHASPAGARKELPR